MTGEARGVNDHGAIVGAVDDVSGVRHAYLWDNGSVLDLNNAIPWNSGWVLKGASDINEMGEICGTGEFNGLPRAYKLTPILSAPRLSGFQPGFSGSRNRIYGIGFTANTSVDLYASFMMGSTSLACGATLDINNAYLFKTVSSDANGRVETEVFLPAILSDSTLYLQAGTAGCATSELLEQDIQ